MSDKSPPREEPPRQTPDAPASDEDPRTVRQRIARLLGRLLAGHWLRSRDRHPCEGEARPPGPPAS